MTGLVIGVLVIVAFVCVVFSLSVKTSAEDERRFAAEKRRVRNWRRKGVPKWMPRWMVWLAEEEIGELVPPQEREGGRGADVIRFPDSDDEDRAS